MLGYLGTYASPDSLGLYAFRFHPHTGAVEPPRLLCPAPDAKYAALWGGVLFAPVNRGEGAGLTAVDRRTGAVLDELLTEGVTACYVALRGGVIFTANYHEGTVLCYHWDGRRLALVRRLAVAPEAGCHQVLFYGSTLLVPCLERDEVRLYALDKQWAALGAIPLPPGAGPRHGVFRGGRLFLVGERSNQLYTLRAGTWDLEHVHPITPGGATAAVRLSPDGRFLYVSTRGADLLTVFRVDGPHPELVQQLPSGGEHPRDFILAPDGRHLLVVHRASGGLVSFALEAESGLIGPVCGRVPLSEGVSVCLEERTDAI